MQEDPRPLDVAEETVAEAGAFVRALDQAGNVGEHERAPAAGDDAEIWMKGREGILGDLGLGRGNRCQEGRLSGVGQADQAGVGDQLQAQPDPALGAFLAGIGAARGAGGG